MATTLQPRHAAVRRRDPVLLPMLAAAAAFAVLALTIGPPPAPQMGAMTHYGELVMANLATVLLAMFVVFFLAYGALFTTPWLSTSGRVEKNQPWHRVFVAALFVYFTGLVVYVLAEVAIPATTAGAWRGLPDAAIIAVWLAAWLPIARVAAATFGLWAISEDRAKLVVLAVIVLVHLAMAGMIPPAAWGYDAPMIH